MTAFQKYALLFISVCFLLLALYVDGAIFWHRGWTAGWNDAMASIQTDTTQHHDTSTYVNPQPVSEEPVATIPAGYVQVKAGTIAQLKARIAELEAAAMTAPIDSAASPIEDTPVDVALPIERKVYQDSTYRAVVEGIQARLAEIQTFNTTTTITKVVKDPVLPNLTLTPAAKLVMTPAGMDAAAMLRVTKWWPGGWRFDGGLGYGLHVGEGIQQPGWYAEIGVGLDIVRK